MKSGSNSSEIKDGLLVNIACVAAILLNAAFWLQVSIFLAERPLVPDPVHGFVFPIPHNGLTTFVTHAEGIRLFLLMICAGFSVLALAVWLTIRRIRTE